MRNINSQSEASITGTSAEACVSSRPVSRLTGEHYRLVKQIITEEVDPPDPALQRTGLVQAVAMPDRHIAWVLESEKENFERTGLECVHESASRSLAV